jgi:hypothetical protein
MACVGTLLSHRLLRESVFPGTGIPIMQFPLHRVTSNYFALHFFPALFSDNFEATKTFYLQHRIKLDLGSHMFRLSILATIRELTFYKDISSVSYGSEW